MTIHIEQLTFDTIIGILDFERVTPQKVIIDVKIDYDYANDTNEFINYAELIELIESMMIEKKYELLESAIHEILMRLSSTYPQIETIKLKISKPDIIKNAQVALSSSWFRA